MTDQIDLFAPAPTPDLEWRKKHLGGRYALWTLFYKGLETGHSITPAGWEDDQEKPWTGSIFTRKEATARAFATREEAQAEAERLFLNPPSYVYPPDEWHARETERLRREAAGEDEWDLPFVEDETELEDEGVAFVPAPASDPPTSPFLPASEKRCAYYAPIDQAGRTPRKRPWKPTILVGPGRTRRFADNCRGAGEYEATIRSGWQPPCRALKRWRNLPAAEPLAAPRPPRNGRHGQTTIDWSQSPDHRDYWAWKVQQELERRNYR